jgi:hypothetical protein
MRIVLFIKLLALFTGLALLGVFLSPLAIPSLGAVSLFVRLLQFEALAGGLAILTTAIYPYVLGVRKGEKVLIITNDPLTNALIIRLATALEGRKLHESIKIGLDDGSVMVGKVDAYPGIISPARVSVNPESNIRVN